MLSTFIVWLNVTVRFDLSSIPVWFPSIGDTKLEPSLKNTFATGVNGQVLTPGPTIPSLPELLAKTSPSDVLPKILSALEFADTNSLVALLSL